MEGLLKQVGGNGLIPPAVGAASDAEGAPSIDVDAFEMPVIEEGMFQGINYGDTPNVSLDDSAFTFGHEDSTAFTPDPSTQPARGWNGNTFTGELIDLGGIFEALPPFEVMEGLWVA